MKPLQTFLETIRALPEEIRRFLAVFSLVIAAIIVFFGWNIIAPYRLTTLSGETISPAAAPGFQNLEDIQKQEALSPLEGITESFKSLQFIIGPKETGRSGLASISTFLEKTWRYVYDPLK